MGASGPITEMTDDYYNKTTAVNFGGVVRILENKLLRLGSFSS